MTPPDQSKSGKAAPETLALVVEDQADTRAWLVQVLRTAFPGIETTETASLAEARDWLRTCAQSSGGAHLTLALVDLGLPDGSGVDLIRILGRDYPDVLSIVATIYDDDAHLFDAIAAGAKGYLLKDQDSEALAHYLRRIESGEPPLSPSIARRMLGHFRDNPPAPAMHKDEAALTPRETEVLRMIGRGLRVGEAARVLGISDHTVAGHVKAIYAKLNIASRAEAGLEAARRGLT